MRIRLILALGAASLVSAGMVAAQERTAEGAHEFLRITFAAGGVNGYFNGGAGENVVQQSWYTCTRQMVFAGSDLMPPAYDDVCGNTRYGTWGAPSYKSISYARVEDCVGRVVANAPYYETQVRSGNAHYQRNPLGHLDRAIDWRKVAEVKQNAAEVSVAEGGVRYRFQAPSQDLATRMAFAMEFLRTTCDPAAATGF